MKIDFVTGLGLVFITLKLCAVIDWSWWLVLLPIYGSALIVLGWLAIAALISFLSVATLWVSDKIEDFKNRK